ncbi:hypothetical protein Trihar35433_2744 [Trichoderma harzianum]|nr:hypothetical protein Trihar35433_2744 [Trichoderma harzianum]
MNQLKFNILKQPIYQPLPSDVHHELPAAESEDAKSWLPFARHKSDSRWSFVVYYKSIACYSWPVLVAAMIWTVLMSPPRSSLLDCLKATSIYSPALPVIELSDTDFANDFIERSPYRGPPTEELESLWFKLWDQAMVLLPSEHMPDLNRHDTTDYMRAPAGEGDGYVASLEVFHQLHCLNYIRQFTWYQMGAYNENNSQHLVNGTLKELRIHTDHCIESLRIALMCQADVSPVLMKWDNNYDPPRPAAEFSSHHRCRNFDAIMNWNEAHGLSTFGNPAHQHNHG